MVGQRGRHLRGGHIYGPYPPRRLVDGSFGDLNNLVLVRRTGAGRVPIIAVTQRGWKIANTPRTDHES